MSSRPFFLNSLRARLLVGIGSPLLLLTVLTVTTLNAAADLSARSGWIVSICLAVVLLLSVLIAWRVSSSVTRPVDRLRLATQQLLTGSFNLAAPEGPNEIAQLIVDF